MLTADHVFTKGSERHLQDRCPETRQAPLSLSRWAVSVHLALNLTPVNHLAQREVRKEDCLSHFNLCQAHLVAYTHRLDNDCLKDFFFLLK